MNHSNFSSWSNELEQTFVVYEETRSVTQKKAWTISAIVAGALLVAVLGIAFGIKPKSDENLTKDMDTSSLRAKGDGAESK